LSSTDMEQTKDHDRSEAFASLRGDAPIDESKIVFMRRLGIKKADKTRPIVDIQVCEIKICDVTIVGVYRSPTTSNDSDMKLINYLKDVPDMTTVVGDFTFHESTGQILLVHQITFKHTTIL
jgi:hypothetical protein